VCVRELSAQCVGTAHVRYERNVARTRSTHRCLSVLTVGELCAGVHSGETSLSHRAVGFHHHRVWCLLPLLTRCVWHQACAALARANTTTEPVRGCVCVCECVLESPL